MNGDEVLCAFIDSIGDEYVYFVHKYMDVRKLVGPLAPFVSEEAIRNAIEHVKSAVHTLPPDVKERIAMRVKERLDMLTDSYVESFMHGRTDRVLESTLQKIDYIRV